MKKIVEYNATTDLIFKGVFTEKKPLKELLSVILREEVKESELIVERDTIDDDIIIKTPRYDIKIKMSVERNIVLEMQRLKPNYNMMDRLIYYATRQYTNSIKKGKNYEPKESIVICFSGFELVNKKCMNTYTLKNEDNEEIMGIKIITIQFTKIKECDNIELKKWLDLITRKDFSEYEGSEGMMEAAEKILKMNSDEKMMYQIIKEEMKYLDEMSEKKAIERKLSDAKEEGIRQGLEQGIEQGIEQGLEKGIEKGLEQGMMLKNKEIVLNMHEKGYSLEIISEITKLTKEEIEAIINS